MYNLYFLYSSINPLQIKYSCEFDTWYDIRLDVDMETDTFDFYLDNELVREDSAFRNTADAINYFSIFGSSDQAGDLLLDYLCVQKGTPDNTTVSIQEITVDEIPDAEFTYDAATQTYFTPDILSFDQSTAKIRVSLLNHLGKVSINGTDLGYTDDNEYVEVPLSSGDNTISVTVTASDYNATPQTATYYINLIRQDSSLLAYLTQLALSDITFTPEFTGTELEGYSITYDGGVTNTAEHILTYPAVTEQCGVSIVLNGTTLTLDETKSVPITL